MKANEIYKLKQKAIELNNRINSTLHTHGVTRNGKIIKPLSDFPETEWKIWVTELIESNKKAWAEINNAQLI